MLQQCASVVLHHNSINHQSIIITAMKTFTITGYNRNNNAVLTLTYNTAEFTKSMMQNAMDRIQLFSASPLRFEIKEI
jgi:hypothetical protein